MRATRKRLTKSFWQFFFSYVVILCIPTIILTWFSYTYFIGHFQEMTYENHLLHQQQKSESMDTMLDELKNISIQFSTHSINLAQLRTSVLDRMELMQRLQGLLALNTNLTDVIFWVPEQELFYSTQSTYSLDTYRRIFDIDLAQVLMDDWQYRQSASTLVTNLFAGNRGQGHYLYFSCPYPYKSTMPTAYLVFCMEPRRFVPAVEGAFTLQYQSQVLIDDIGLGSLDEQPPINKSDPKHTFITTRSGSNALTLTTMIDNNVLFSSFHRIRDMFLACNVAVFLICLLILSYFSQKNAKPINDLNSMLVKLGVISEEVMLRTTETSRTIEYMQELVNENRQLDSQLLEEQYISRNLWLSKLLNGHEQYLPDILPHLEKYGILLHSAYYTVALVYIDAEVQNNRFFDEFLFQDEHHELHYYVDAQNKIFLLIGSDTASCAGKLVALAGRIRDRFGAIDIRCEIFLGNTHPGIVSIHRAYTSTLATVEDEIVYGGKIHLPSEQQGTPMLFYPHVELESLQQALRDGNGSQFLAVVGNISYQMENTLYRDFWYKTVCYEIVNIIIRNALHDENREQMLGHINHFLHELSRTASRRDITGMLKDFAHTVYRQMETETDETERSAKTIDAVLGYIAEHYAEQDFFLGRVTERFGISPNNLSQQLKRIWGMPPARYINALRVNDAKEMLAHTDLSVKEIGLAVGFSDASTFIRNFKAVTDTTPNQYRGTHRVEK